MKFKKIKSKSEIKLTDPEAYLIDAPEKEIRSIIASLQAKNTKKIIAVLGRDNIFNRRMVEKTNITYLVSPERGKQKDTLKQRDSGFNHVLAKIAKKNKIGVIIDFNDINSMKDKKEKAQRLGRIIQNIQVCRKADCKIKIMDFYGKANKKTLQSFGFSLGMSSQQVIAATKP